MSIRKQSLYGSFVERVLLPTLRIGTLLLALLAIGCGSWLETNESISNCSFKSGMSFHQVHLYRNITNNLTTPDSVSFGLWRTCYFYALNCSCTSTNLRFQPDVSTILQVATEHNAKPPLTELTSVSRIIPLMLATIFGGAAFFIGLLANRRGKYMFRKIVVALLCICAILVASAFGWTYNQYFKKILKTCKDPNNTIYCARHVVGTEVIVFAIALALLLVAFIFWFLASAFFTKQDEQEEPFGFTFRKKPSFEIPEYSSRQDELAVWPDDSNEADDDGYWEQHHVDKKLNYYDSPVEQEQRMSLNEKVSLTPPPPVCTNRLNSSPRGHKPRQKPHQLSKSRRASSHEFYNGSSPQKYRQTKTRQESNDSALTFGNNKRQQRRKSSGRPLSELDQQQHHNKPRNKTPTSMSPHPFQFPNNSEMMMRNSFCMTPYYYNEDNGSSGSGSSHGGYFIQDSSHARRTSNQFQVPILGMPPAAVEHPLNKKVITDKRIQSYLQQH